MNLLDFSGFDSEVLLDECISALEANGTDTTRFTDARGDLLIAYQAYTESAGTQRLYEFPSSAHGHDEQIVLGALTKGDLTELYSTVMLKDSTEGRLIYERLLAVPKSGRCPYCGFGSVATLDHFLPKARYPRFSILCPNLIACCDRCNKKMGGGVVSAENMAVHPYYEDRRVTRGRWLHARLEETTPATVVYRAEPPVDWPLELQRRIRNHFSGLDLAGRYAIEAADEVAVNSQVLAGMTTADISRHLQTYFAAHSALKLNSWETALYAELKESAWYVNGGFAARAY